MKADLLRRGKENQVQTDCWTVCDAKRALAHVTSTTALRECSDGVCARDTCGCRIVSAVASGGTVEKMAKRNGGGAAGCEEGVRSRGTSNIVQSDETARCEPVLDGVDCSDLERKLHESTPGNGHVVQNSDEQEAAPRSARIYGPGASRLDKELGFKETCTEP